MFGGKVLEIMINLIIQKLYSINAVVSMHIPISDVMLYHGLVLPIQKSMNEDVY